MNTNKKFGALTSSQDPEAIANKVKGAVLMISSLAILVASKAFGLHISVNDMTELATVLGTLSGAIWTVYGCILHLIAFFYQVKQEQA